MALINLDSTLGDAALAIISPDVPDTDGVPPVIRSRLRGVTAAVSAISSDSANIATQANSEWGIYDTDGTKVLVPDTFLAVEIAAESRVADYPIEGGGFESYNKVQVPFSPRIDMVKTGKKAERAAFLDFLETMRKSTTLYDVVTPEKTYLNVTLERYNVIRNTDTGPQQLRVQVVLAEIRVQAQVKFTNELTQSTLATDSGGSVQTAAPKSAPPGAPK